MAKLELDHEEELILLTHLVSSIAYECRLICDAKKCGFDTSFQVRRIRIRVRILKKLISETIPDECVSRFLKKESRKK